MPPRPEHRRRTGAAALAVASVTGMLAAVTSAQPAAAPRDTLYVNGYLYTADARDTVQEALLVHEGRIAFVGSSTAGRKAAGTGVRVIDLQQRMLMPGLVDGHMHPLEGGATLLKCNLNYERLTVAQLQSRIQACLDATRGAEPDHWLEVVNWFREAMIPNGATTSRATLDALNTRRPIFVMSSFGHTALVNTRALALAHITSASKDPLGGRIDREPGGGPSGILEDAAFESVTAIIPKPTAAEDTKAAAAALEAMRKQGITSFLDAMATPRTLSAFAAVERQQGLTARAHFAVLITPEEGRHPRDAVAKARGLAGKYDEGEPQPVPGISVRNIKLFMDGVISAPACTGAMLAPYFRNAGTPEAPRWTPGTNRGPQVYFPAAVLQPLLVAAAEAGLEPHMHADGDRAVHEALNGVAALREALPGKAIRAAIAHDEIVDPGDFARFQKLDAVPVLSFQWEKPAPDTIDGAREYLGPERFRYIEPAGYLVAAHARIAYGSDWPVDPLNEWFALKVGITRENDPSAGPKYSGRLGSDPGLTLTTALRAITVGAAYELHAEREVGSLEVGKLADFIVLDRNVFKIPASEVADVRVLLTVVGGRTVHAHAPFAAD